MPYSGDARLARRDVRAVAIASRRPIGGPGIPPTLDAAALRAGLARCGRIVARHQRELTRLDAILGDGDHGDNLVIGFRAVDELLAELPADTRPGELLRAVGHRLVAAVGGASGPLYGTACIEAGFRAGDAETLDGATVAAMLEAAAAGLARRGRCQPGDKTILDTLAPAAGTFEAELTAGATPGAAYGAAIRAGLAVCARPAISWLGVGWRCASVSDPSAIGIQAPCRACSCCARWGADDGASRVARADRGPRAGEPTRVR